MASLSLYIDKWFITVAINCDGNVMPLSLPNAEDRIWLYFHEDIANSRIEYGKAFENSYRDKLPHYFGDIFNMIEEGDHHFSRFEGRQEEMREIFKVAGIFNHIHQAMNESGAIDTYISFSSDIPDVARWHFIKELKEANFTVVESVARISHLALEECKKRNVFVNDGIYLVLTATNDNFHYSLYQNKGGIFFRMNEGTLPGLGFDVRRRALVEYIVDNINKNTKLLRSREEIELECVRQNRFASVWLDKIAASKRNMPVALDGITFAVAPNNPFVVPIYPDKLGGRTTGIVDEVVRKIADFVRENQIQPHEIEGVVFIGNTFTNDTFATAIKERFNVDNRIAIYRDDELPKVVSIYSHIDCNQFKGATAEFMKDAETQERLKKQAKEEEDKRLKAEASAQRQQELIDSRKKAEQEYNDAVENIERYESDHNYEEMLEWAEIALTNRPDDEFAKEKTSLARQLIAEQKAANRQFNMVLQRAKTAFSEERWTDAVSQCEIALELRTDSDEASRLKAEALRRMEIKDKVQTLLSRADVFFAQKLYTEASKEVSKILVLDPSNSEAKQIALKISEANSQHEKTINNLVAKLNEAELQKDFTAAIGICESLIEEDAANIRKWTRKKEQYTTNQKELEENRKKLDALRQDINTALFNEDWVKLKLLCESFLSIEPNQDISQFLAKSKKRIEEIKVKEAKEKALASINSSIIGGFINAAQKEIDRFAQNYPSELSIVKDLRKKLFSFDTDSSLQQQKSKYTPRNPIGFNSSNTGDLKDKDDFFETATSKGNPSRKTKERQDTEKKISKKEDFFDSAFAQKLKKSDPEPNNTNNDFNF